MGQMKAAGCFAHFQPVNWRNDPGDLGAQFQPLQAGADHQTDLEHCGPHPRGGLYVPLGRRRV